MTYEYDIIYKLPHVLSESVSFDCFDPSVSGSAIDSPNPCIHWSTKRRLSSTESAEFGLVGVDGGVGDGDRHRVIENDLWWTGDIGGMTTSAGGDTVPGLEGSGMGHGGSTLTALVEQSSRGSCFTSGTAVHLTDVSGTKLSAPPSTSKTYSFSIFTFLHRLNFL